MSRLQFGSLFAGIGGFDLGFERAGMRCLWQVEKDPFCQKVLAKHWPHVERFEDVRAVGKHNLQPVDVICGGFPCQPHSEAGSQKGETDDRDLWPEYRRVIEELRPAYIVGENVLGIRNTILDSVLSDLESLEYEAQTFDIPACGIGANHRRRRLFIVAHAQSKPIGVVCRSRRDILQTSEAGQRDIAQTLGSNGWCNPWQRGYIGARVGRVANGVPNRVDRLRSLGNAVVPQVAEFIGRLVVAHYEGGRSE